MSAVRSQIATLEGSRSEHRKYLPWAFTEHGTSMVANGLNGRRGLHRLDVENIGSTTIRAYHVKLK